LIGEPQGRIPDSGSKNGAPASLFVAERTPTERARRRVPPLRSSGRRTFLRIAQVAPLAESVPPHRYGGTERVVHYLTEELVALGHTVTLFASGDSRTSARLIAPCERGLRMDAAGTYAHMAAETLLAEQLAQCAERGDFELIHLHTDYLAWPLARRLGLPYVTTFHGRLDLRGLAPLATAFGDAALVSISDDQRRPLPQANWRHTVHHGLPEHLYAPGDGRGGYLAFLGRISPEKRVDRAIEIAARAGMELRVAAKVDPADQEYFEREIEPLLAAPHVTFLGEIDDEEKAQFLGDAAALLFPIDWPEPFGLALIESFACGTPVVAFRRGSVPEIVRHGITGFIVDDVRDAVQAVESLHLLSRGDVRAEFETRFTARRMAEDYVTVYDSLLEGAQIDLPAAGGDFLRIAR